MGKRILAFASVLLMALSGFCVFASDSVESIRTVLPESAVSRVLPVDPVIGQVVDFTESPEHEILYQALKSEYSVLWVETYIEENMRSILVRLFDFWFSENLSAKTVLLSTAHRNADGSVGINARCGKSCMSFVLKDAKIIAMRTFE